MPEPTLVKPLALVEEMAPENMVLLASPEVRSPLSTTEPAPDSEPIVSSSAKVKVAPLSTVTALLLPIELLPESAKVPALAVISPVWLLLPDRLKVPAPVLIKAPVPETTPDKVAAAVFSILPPLLPTLRALSMVVIPVTFNIAPEPLSVTAPKPKLASLAIDNVFRLPKALLPLMVVLVWVLLPDKTTAPVPPEPSMLRLPLLMMPLKVKSLSLELSMVRSKPPKLTLPLKVNP